MLSAPSVAVGFAFGLSGEDVFCRKKNRFEYFVQSLVASNYCWLVASKFRKELPVINRNGSWNGDKKDGNAIRNS